MLHCSESDSVIKICEKLDKYNNAGLVVSVIKERSSVDTTKPL